MATKRTTGVDTAALWAKRQVLGHGLGKVETETRRRAREQDRHVARAEDLVVNEGESSAVISPEVGFNIHNFRIFVSVHSPHTHPGRHHTHGEAVKYYMTGRAIEYIGDKEYEVKAGDFAFIPANTWHGTQVPYSEPVKRLAILQMPGTGVQLRASYIVDHEPSIDTNQPLTSQALANLSPHDLYQTKLAFIHHLGKLDEDLDRLRQKGQFVRRAEEIVWEEARSQPTREVEGQRYCRIVSPDLGFNIHTFRIFKMEQPPHTEQGRYHTHGEAVKHYLSGRAIEYIGDKEYEVKAGDFSFIPANTWHGTQNPYDEPVQVMAFLQMPGTYLQVPAPYIYRDEDLVRGA